MPSIYKREEKTEKGIRDYIDKEEFYQHLVEYKKACNEADEKGLPRPQISDEIGKCIMMIVDRSLRSHRFNGYTDLWKDEMRSEALVSALRSVPSFNLEHKNPFAYFTTAVWYTFYGVIAREKKYHQTAITYNTETHNDYTPIGADGFEYRVPEAVHDRIAISEARNEWVGRDFDWEEKIRKAVEESMKEEGESK